MRVFERRTLGGWAWELFKLAGWVGLLWLIGALSWEWSGFVVGWVLAALLTRPALYTLAGLALGWVLEGLLARRIGHGWAVFVFGWALLVVGEWWSHDGRVNGRWAVDARAPRWIWLGPPRRAKG